MKIRIFNKNIDGLSIMYDAVFFMVMISISGAVLIPALNNQTSIQTSIEKNREEIVDETLLMVLNSRIDDFEYVYAKEQIDFIAETAGIDTSDEVIYKPMTTGLLGKEIKHKTFSDICVENLISQIKIFDMRLNIFTNDYDKSINDMLYNTLYDFLGDKYNFNLSVKWNPIVDIEYGGSLSVGKQIPDTDTFVSKSYSTIPTSIFTDYFTIFETKIEKKISIINDYIIQNTNSEYNKTEFEKLITNSFNDTYDSIICDELVNTSFDFLFGDIEDSVSNIFPDSLDHITDFLDIFGSDLGFEIDNIIKDKILELSNIDIYDYNNDREIDMEDIFSCLKFYIKEKILEKKQARVKDEIIILSRDFSSKHNEIDDFTEEEVNDLFYNYFNKKIDVLRAEFKLTIWEVR